MTVYQANFTKSSLIVPESRIVAGLLLQAVSPDEWREAIVDQNLLQKRTRETALTYARLARARLETMGAGLWELVRDGVLPVATHAVLAAAVKFSPLLGDFMRTVLAEQYRLFKSHLNPSLWDQYLDNCRDREPRMPDWSDTTCAKLRQNALRILAEAGYIDGTRSLRLQPARIAPEVIGYLRQHDEDYALQCLRVSP